MKSLGLKLDPAPKMLTSFFPMYNPVSTYRLQFNKDFTFEDARRESEYFHLLGAGTIYASPIFTATPGSIHGYDVTDALRINPEIGSEEELRKLTKNLKNRRIGWLQDFVPNHMAFNQHNKWLMDVLEKGRDSEYAKLFDTERQQGYSRSKLMVPFLGDDPSKVLERGELKLTWTEGSFKIVYFDTTWPLRFESFLWIMDQSEEAFPNSLSLLLDHLRLDEKSPDYLFLNGEWERTKEKLAALTDTDKALRDFFEQLGAQMSGNTDAMRALLDNQHYVLTHWQDTEQKINYRRFFTVNDLICLRMEDKEVFDFYHRQIQSWVRSHFFDGLRVDHVDGIRYPKTYLHRLRKLTGHDVYLSVEKILEKGEDLPSEWPVQGTTGYDFLGLVNNLFSHKYGLQQLQSFYNQITGTNLSAEESVYRAKKMILTTRMGGELEALTSLFQTLRLLEGEQVGKYSSNQIKATIAEILLAMPVYRIYPESLPLEGESFQLMKKVFSDAFARNSEIEPVLSVFEELLFAEDRIKGNRDDRILTFFSRMMQYSGPLMAKGVEDTTMYQYNCFIGHNEVGDNPASNWVSFDHFHEAMHVRHKCWPLTMNCTSTHDTKRGEDVRARLNVLTEMSGEWTDRVEQWMEMNRPLKIKSGDKMAPSPSEEYFIYQTLVGVAPFDENLDKTFLQRISDYLIKVLREAKLNSSWREPDTGYEEAVLNFVRKIFITGHGFKNSFFDFQRKVAHYGIFNSLGQLALKCTCPGIPDIYRGTEFWDLTLVDPDNRQPVDFNIRHKTLKELKEQYSLAPAKMFQELMANSANGHIKLWLTHRILRYRKENQSLFSKGNYIPLKVKGILKNHVIAFARNYQNGWHVSIVPIGFSEIEHTRLLTPGDVDWKNTRVVLPEDAPSDWINVFTGRPLSIDNEVSVSEILGISPVGLLHADTRRKARSAGILMHVTSLPGRFASGDFGPDAFRFVDFIKESGHSFWQVLPFTPTAADGGWSPYSSSSAFAGNIMLISPQKLAEDYFVSKKELKEQECALSEKADFRKALSIREKLTRQAYENFLINCSIPAKQKFYNFCEQEKHWLDDYALFLLFKQKFDNIPWSQWPSEIRNRDKGALQLAKKENEKEIGLHKFRQYLFSLQWSDLKLYANHHGIRIIGDIPIYVNYDNADVWAHPHLFKLHSNKEMSVVAGVPPDYFSETGQLWGMPVYDWKKLEQEDYGWWLQRVRKNLALYDIVRLDHFRGFSSYWEVPAGEETAENGSWVTGPGKSFFTRLKKEFPLMPFIAEDLGEVDEDVYQLRDEFQLPGMRVLQFAFGEDLPESVHIPHNYNSNSVVYTGTHDNNTTQGWFRFEADKAVKKRLKLYTGQKVKAKNIHRILTRLAWASRGRLVVVPIQDLLGKGAEAQMNRPSVAGGNWTWRLKTMEELVAIAGETRELLGLFSR